MLKSLTLKRWTSFLLALALVFTMLPLQQASAAITFTFDSYSTDPESPTQVNGDTIDLKGTYNGIASNTITYKVEQIVDGKVVATTPGTGVAPILEGTNRYNFANVKLFAGLNRITLSGNSSGSIQSNSAYVFFPNVPTIYDIKLTDGRELTLNTATLVNTETIALMFKAPNATNVTVQGKAAFSGGGDTYLVSDVPVDEGLNTIVIVASNATNTYSITRDVVRLYDVGTTVFDVSIINSGTGVKVPKTSLDGNPTVGSNMENDTLVGRVTGKIAFQKDPDNPTPDLTVLANKVDGGASVLNSPVTAPANIQKLGELSVTGATYDYVVYQFTSDTALTITLNDKYNLAVDGSFGTADVDFGLLFNYRKNSTPYITEVNQLYNVKETTTGGTFTYSSSSLFTDNLTFFQTPIWISVKMNNYDPDVHQISIDTTQNGATVGSPKMTYDKAVKDYYVTTNGELIFKITNLPAGDQTLNIRVQKIPVAPATTATDEDVKNIKLTFIPTPFIQLTNVYDNQSFKSQSGLTTITGKMVNFNMTAVAPAIPADLNSLTVTINGTSKSVAANPTSFTLAQASSQYTGEFTFSIAGDTSLQLVNGPNSIVVSANAGGIPVSTNITVFLFPDDLPQITTIQPVPVGQSSDADNLFQATGDLAYTTTEKTVEILFSALNVARTGGEVVISIDGKQHKYAKWNGTTFVAPEGGITFVGTGANNIANFRITYSAPTKPEDTSLLLPDSGTKSITIMAAAGTTTSSKTLQITRIRVPYKILSPKLPEESVINQNFMTVSIDAEGADQILVGKEEMIRGTDGIFRLDMYDLKKGANKIKFTIITGTTKNNGEFTVNYATQNEIGAQFKAPMPSSGKLSAFNGAIEISFPKGTMLKQPSMVSQSNSTQIELFNSQRLLVGIADPIDGRTIKRYNRVGEHVNGVPQDGKFANIGANSYVTNILQGTRANFGYASQLFWVDGGYFDSTTNTFKTVDGLQPYEAANNDAVYLRGNNMNKWLVPTNRGTITLDYDPSIRNETANNLSVWRFTGNSWQNIGGTVNTGKKTITASFDGFGYYAVMSLRYGFEDVTGHPYARDYLNTMFTKGIMQARSSGSFGVYENITRGEFATMIVKILDLPLNYDTQNQLLTFNDVPNYAVNGALWDYRYIETAARAGIISGLKPRIFNPGGNLTREQAAVIIARALNFKLGTQEKDRLTLAKQFVDAGLIDFYAVSHVQAVVKDKIMQGQPNPLEEGQKKPTYSFSPRSFLNRADMAIISYNIMDKLGRI